MTATRMMVTALAGDLAFEKGSKFSALNPALRRPNRL